MVTAGLAGLGTLAGARPRVTLADMDLSLTGLLLGSVVAVLVGGYLFLIIARAGSRFREQVNCLANFHSQGLVLFQKLLAMTDDSQIQEHESRCNDWEAHVIEYLRQRMPNYVSIFQAQVISAVATRLQGEANDLAIGLASRLERLSEIIVRMSMANQL